LNLFDREGYRAPRRWLEKKSYAPGKIWSRLCDTETLCELEHLFKRSNQMENSSLKVNAPRDEIETLDYAPAVQSPRLRRWIGLSILLALAAGYGSYLWHRPQPNPRLIMISRIRVPLIPPVAMAGAPATRASASALAAATAPAPPAFSFYDLSDQGEAAPASDTCAPPPSSSADEHADQR
jgi:hypothetical protein